MSGRLPLRPSALLLAALLAIPACFPALAGDPPEAAVPVGGEEAPADGPRETLERLRREADLLRKENISLRRQLEMKDPSARAAGKEAGGSASPGKEAEIDSAGSDLAKLRREVDRLRKANQSLRRRLVAARENDAPPDGDGPTLRYSRSSSGKRHNSSCRYYDPSPEAQCGKDDGTPCKVCGG